MYFWERQSNNGKPNLYRLQVVRSLWLGKGPHLAAPRLQFQILYPLQVQKKNWGPNHVLSLQQSRTQSSLHDINRSLVKKTWPEVIVVKPLNNKSNRDT